MVVVVCSAVVELQAAVPVVVAAKMTAEFSVVAEVMAYSTLLTAPSLL